MPEQNYDHDYDTTIHRPSYLKAFGWQRSVSCIYPLPLDCFLLDGAGVEQELQGVVPSRRYWVIRVRSAVSALASEG